MLKSLNFIRSKSFWFFDKIKGGRIQKHYDEITCIQENYHSQKAKDMRSAYLSKILDHATSTTPFYKKYKDYKSLEDFPVIYKTTIQENPEIFNSETYLNAPTSKVATSGSTGIPFILFQDANKKHRNTADTIYFLEKANYVLGQKLYDLEVWRGINMNSPAKALLKNLKYVDITIFRDPEIKDFLAILKNTAQPQHLIGFVSAFESICKYLDRIDSKPLQTNVISIIAISEYLTDYVKKSMQKYFNVPVVSRYSSEEVGILAQQPPIENNISFELNWASYHFEILDLHHDKLAKPGKLGRLVITDFFNYCMPLIRYDTGDIALYKDENEGKAPSLKRIDGRRMDLIYDTKGELVSSFIVYTKFYDYYSLLNQYQFIQKDTKDYIIKLNVKQKFLFEEKLIHDFKKDFGEDASITIQYVEDIPTLSSGKRKKVVSLLKPN